MAEGWAIKFYKSPQWRTLRQSLVIERGAKCEMCGRSFALNPSELVGHHKIELTPENITNPDVALNPSNVMIICSDCHNKIHGRYGYHQEQKVYLVYGPPCSGKSSLVSQLSHRGDLIVNMDTIYTAISGLPMYDKPNGLKNIAFKVRDDLIEMISTRYGKWEQAFIEGGYPLRAVRESIIAKTGAEPILKTASKEECMSACEERGVFADEWKGYITKWFDQYQP